MQIVKDWRGNVLFVFLLVTTADAPPKHQCLSSVTLKCWDLPELKIRTCKSVAGWGRKKEAGAGDSVLGGVLFFSTALLPGWREAVGSPQHFTGSDPHIRRLRSLSKPVGFPELRLAVSFSAAVSRDLFCLVFRQNNSHSLSNQKGSGTGYRLPVIRKIDNRTRRWVWLCLS